jgi:L-lactate dehydrogenase complex protein LldG
MEESTSKEKVLKKIRNALISKLANPYPNVDLETSPFHEIKETLDVAFAQEFTNVGGRFVYCENSHEFISNIQLVLKNLELEEVFCLDPEIRKVLESGGIKVQSSPEEFLEVKIALTGCEFLISRTGSIMVSSRQTSGRRLNVFPEVHLVVAFSSQLVPDTHDALKKMKQRYSVDKFPSMISFITGPSRTADIEKTLVMGAHGPKELFVFFIDGNSF